MRPIRAVPLVLIALTGLALAGCGSESGGPGWTYAPAPSATAAASGAASGAPSGNPSAEPGGSPAASPGADGPTVTAQGVAFVEKELTVPADEPFTIHFVNADAPGTPHDIDIRDSSDQTLQDQATIDGGEEATYEYTALAAGEYVFICSIHPIPNMTGTLTVE
jgi:plastocyanin